MYCTTHLRSFIVLALSLVCFMAADTHAGGQRHGKHGHHGFFGRGGGYNSSYGLGYYGLGGPYEMPYAMGRIPTPPYFALHPPVHYSDVVPRSYGYSPFAYPGTYVTPEIAAAPAEVVNPYVEPKVQAESTNHLTAVPTVIRNPFVGRAQRDGVEVARSKD